MKWFKHYSDMYRGRTIEHLYKEFGHTGISCYHTLMEICAEKLEKNPNESLANVPPTLSFSAAFVRRTLRLSSAKVEAFLSQCSTLDVLSFKFVGQELHIEIPKLLELLDSDQKRARHKRDRDATRARPELELELDKEKKQKLRPEPPTTRLSKKDTEHNREENRKIKEAYVNAFRLRYGVEPATDNAAFNTQVSNLRKKIGVDSAVQLVKFYLTHEDFFFIKNTHSFGICLSKAETLYTQMQRDERVTNTKARSYEKRNQTQETLDELDKIFKAEERDAKNVE